LTETTYKVEGLLPATDYEFRVSAENEIGTSTPSTSNPVRYGKYFCLVLLFQISVLFTKKLNWLIWHYGTGLAVFLFANVNVHIFL